MGRWTREATSLLIKEVKKLPFLYDPSDKGYHDRQVRRAAMLNIALLLSDLRPGTTCEEVRMRWSALRSTFQTSITKMKRHMSSATQGSEFTKVWYFDEMLFLCDILPLRNDFYYTANGGAESQDNNTQDGDVHHSATVAEETMDETPNENLVAEVSAPGVSSKNESQVYAQHGNLQNNHERDAPPQENLQRDIATIENPHVESIQRGDQCNRDPSVDRISAGDSGGIRRKRMHDNAFYNTLDFAVQRLIDRSAEDADFVFGKFIAHELKSLTSPALRKQLKHKIMLDIIEIQNLQE